MMFLLGLTLDYAKAVDANGLIIRKVNESFKTPKFDEGKRLVAAYRPKRKEDRIRKKVEKILGVPFPKVRPTWLINPETKHLLELDGYNSDLRMAWELQGVQHNKYTPHYHGTYQQFEAQQRRDHYKRTECMRRGILLIEFPYEIDEDQLEQFIFSEIAKRKLMAAITPGKKN